MNLQSAQPELCFAHTRYLGAEGPGGAAASAAYQDGWSGVDCLDTWYSAPQRLPSHVAQCCIKARDDSGDHRHALASVLWVQMICFNGHLLSTLLLDRPRARNRENGSSAIFWQSSVY
jgi:hypothetical protein